MVRVIQKTWKKKELSIRGTMVFPEDFSEEKTYEAVISCHGFTGNYMDTQGFSERLAKKGYVACSFSFCGGSREDTPKELISEGKTTAMSVLSEVEDLLCVIDEIDSLPFIKEKGIILLGFSQGGFVAGLTAARRKEKVEKLVMVYPALCIPDHARAGRMGGACYDPENVPEILDCGSIHLGKAFHEEMVSLDPFRLLPEYDGPVLILHGLCDGLVDYAYSIRAKKAYRPGQCRLHLIRDMGHGQNEVQTESLLGHIEAFLKGYREILSLRVLITRQTEEREGGNLIRRVYFTGYCENEIFSGTVSGEGVDTQTIKPGGKTVLKAVYTLFGVDGEGQPCKLSVVNTNESGRLIPAIKTDSKALAFLNKATLASVLDFDSKGVTVSILAL